MKILALAVWFLVLVSSPAQAGSGAHGAPGMPPKDFSQPRERCVECMGDDAGWNGIACCAPDFAKSCDQSGGILRWADLHPVYTRLLGCFDRAPDMGRPCASDEGCSARACDLRDGTVNGSCKLVSKEVTDPVRGYFQAVYQCETEQPGSCLIAPRNRTNPGGVSHTFRMNGRTLLEVRKSGPIH